MIKILSKILSFVPRVLNLNYRRVKVIKLLFWLDLKMAFLKWTTNILAMIILGEILPRK